MVYSTRGYLKGEAIADPFIESYRIADRSTEAATFSPTLIHLSLQRVEGSTGEAPPSFWGISEGTAAIAHALDLQSQQWADERRALIASTEAAENYAKTLAESLAAKEQELATLNTAHEQQFATLKDAHQEELASVKAILAAREEEVASLKPVIEAREEEISSLKPVLAAREAELDSIKPILAAREEELASIKPVLAAREEEVAGLKAVLETREAELATTKATLTEREAELAVIKSTRWYQTWQKLKQLGNR
jgi:chromosome segregation ATPase